MECGDLGVSGDGGGLLNLPILLSFLSPFPSLPLPPSASWLPPSMVRDGHWMGVWSSEKWAKDEHGTNRLKHKTWPFGFFGSGCAICGCRLKTILAVINEMRHGLNKILYYVIGAYTIAKMKH